MSGAILLTLAARAVQVLAGFASAIATARFLGPEARGQYFFVVTVTLVVVQIANLGLHASNTYRVARDERLLGPLVANSLWSAATLGAGTAVTVTLALQQTSFVNTSQPELLWFAVLLAPATLFFMLGTNLLVGIRRIGTFNAFEILGNLLVVAALLCAGVSGARAGGFLLASSLAWTCAAVLLAGYLVRLSRAALRFRLDVFLGGVRYSLKSYVIAALGYLVLRGNVFLLQHYRGSTELGYYSVAAQAADVIAILPTSVALVLFPNLVAGARSSWTSTLRTTWAVAGALAVVCGAAAVLAEPFMRIAFGAEFEPAAQVLRLLLPGVFALGTTTILSQFVAAIGLPRVQVAVWAVTLAVALGLGAALIPDHAGAGAAVALSAAYALLLALVAVVAYRRRGQGTAPAVPPSVSHEASV